MPSKGEAERTSERTIIEVWLTQSKQPHASLSVIRFGIVLAAVARKSEDKVADADSGVRIHTASLVSPRTADKATDKAETRRQKKISTMRIIVPDLIHQPSLPQTHQQVR